jgi:hypothetical protein
MHSVISALDGGEWSASRPGRFTPREVAPGTHWIGGWVGPRALLDEVVKRKIPISLRESNPDRPARSLALYRLSYHGSCSHKEYKHGGRDDLVIGTKMAVFSTEF